MKRLLVLAIGSCLLLAGRTPLPAAVKAQDPPKVGCSFEGYDGKLAEVTTKSAGLDRGEMVVIYRSEGDWTCAYLTGKNGSSPGWIVTRTIRPIASDPNPPLAAWLGTWGFEENGIK